MMYILILKFIENAQRGSSWEIPIDVIIKGNNLLLLATIASVLNVIFLIKMLTGTLFDLKNKIFYLLMSILALIILYSQWKGIPYNLVLESPFLGYICKFIFYPQMIILLAAMIMLNKLNDV